MFNRMNGICCTDGVRVGEGVQVREGEAEGGGNGRIKSSTRVVKPHKKVSNGKTGEEKREKERIRRGLKVYYQTNRQESRRDIGCNE
ncbi:hypothetical protein TWF694_000613 [Orbilia ellipsospora]|uniref:Uncharacterized protein n=1 Tax=Orbilia ellipsospora TaxID=2528407 RepID=A0AAV9XSI0_9PEZI